MPTKRIVPDGHKYCSRCGKNLPIELFYKSRASETSGLCKVHHQESGKESRKRWNENNKKKIKEYQKIYQRKRYAEKVGSVGNWTLTNRYKRLTKILTDIDKMPELNTPYDGMKMIDIPEWYLIRMTEKKNCDKRIMQYVEINIKQNI